MFRFPDKPVRSHPSILAELKDGEWLAQYKLDGWRCLLEVGATTDTFTSRHNKPLPVSDECRKLVRGATAGICAGTILDGEWLGRRAGQAERLIFFDVLRLGGIWQLDRGALTRFYLLEELLPDHPTLIVPNALTGYAAMFDASRERPDCEGIVLKRLHSTLICSVRTSVLNPSWIKVKYREGAGGNVQAGRLAIWRCQRSPARCGH